MPFAKLLNLPFLVFGSAALAFGGWIAYEATKPIGPKTSAARATGHDPFERSGPPVEAVLGMVHHGIARPHVERHLTGLTPAELETSDVSSGATPMRSRYRVALERPVPHLMPRVLPHMFKPGPYLLTLEFDGSKPGHPLVRAELTPE